MKTVVVNKPSRLYNSSSVCTPSAIFGLFNSTYSPSTNKFKKQQLLSLCGQSNRGLISSTDTTKQILSLAEELASIQQDFPTVGPQLNATWKLLWTTEKETLFIINPTTTQFFKTTAGDVFQVIDTDSNRLQNVITFPPEGAFIVESSAFSSPNNNHRVDFKFKSASLALPKGKKLTFPPLGKGWFDTVYLDKDIRIAKDVRGDTLIVARDGPPRWF
jgi:hypothetical protein